MSSEVSSGPACDRRYLQNCINLPVSEAIDTCVYRVGLAGRFPKFSSATAMGLFHSVVALFLIVGVNYVA